MFFHERKLMRAKHLEYTDSLTSSFKLHSTCEKHVGQTDSFSTQNIW